MSKTNPNLVQTPGRFTSWLVLWVLLLSGLTDAQARRLALVIGNENYQNVPRVEKAGADAQAMFKELNEAGFEVRLQANVGYRKMVVAFEELYDKIKLGDEVVLFYAGHGVLTDRGSYLLPVDIAGETQSQVEKVSYPLNVALEEFDRLKARVSVVIVDACRDNPLRANGRPIGAARGLSNPPVSKGQMVIFSAGRNQRSLDALGAGDQNPNGLFTREWVRRMREPGQSIQSLAAAVRESVEQLAQTARHEQRPLVLQDLASEFYLYPSTHTAAAPVAESNDAREDRYWSSAKATDNIEGYQAYLAAFPEGRYKGLARSHISRLSRQPATANAPPPTATVSSPAQVALAVQREAPPPAPPPKPPRRVALVIGNAAYNDAPLRNTVNDAQDMSAALKRLGFTVTTLLDRSRLQMVQAIREFGQASAGADAALFYYAGHGAQVRGQNYLLPVGQRYSDERDVEDDSVDVRSVLGRLEEAAPRVSLLVLDACRNNTLARSGRSVARGLARMDAPSGALIAFSAQAGAEALDGSGRNGIYTARLLKHIETPGITVEQMFKRVREDVESDSGRRQSPREESSLKGDDFYFVLRP